MKRLRFPNGYEGDYDDIVAAVYVKKGRAVEVESKKEPVSEGAILDEMLEKDHATLLRMATDQAIPKAEELTHDALAQALADKALGKKPRGGKSFKRR